MMNPNDELQKLSYIKWQELYEHEKPYLLFHNLRKCPPDQPQSNLSWEAGRDAHLIRDVRGRESEFTLDDHGFSFVTQPTTFIAFTNRQAVESTYLPEVEQYLRRHVDSVDRSEERRVGKACR